LSSAISSKSIRCNLDTSDVNNSISRSCSFSTARCDDVWDWIKKDKLLKLNTKLLKWAEKQAEKEQTVTHQVVGNENIQNEHPITKKCKEYLGLHGKSVDDFDARLSEDDFIDEYDEATFAELLKRQMDFIQFLREHNGTKYLANRVLLIFDDQVGSSLYSDKRQSAFKGFCTRHRHYGISTISSLQAFKECQKTVRTVTSAMIIFEIPNEKELESIYESFPNRLKRDDWMTMYHRAIDSESGTGHNFLYMNMKKPKHQRCMKNFDSYLVFE